jgi:hypothetical protein
MNQTGKTMRIGPGGILLKYRSYLHDDSPVEDPIALHLSWPEIVDAQLQQEHFEIEKPMTETEFKSLIATLLSRDEKIEAIKLVRLQMGLNTTDAKAFIVKTQQ